MSDSIAFGGLRHVIKQVYANAAEGGEPPAPPVSNPPTIVSLNYTVGDPAGGGQSIVITGTNLDTVTTVTFGGASATIGSQDATTVTVTLPAHAAGLVDVVATNPDGSDIATNAFRYFDLDTISTERYEGSYGGAPWSPAYGSYDLAEGVGAPSVGTAQGGYTPADFNGASNNFYSALGSTLNEYISEVGDVSNGFSGWALVDVTSASNVNGEFTSEGCITCDSGGYFGFFVSNFSSTAARFGFWNPVTGNEHAVKTYTTGQYALLAFTHDGTSTGKVSVNGVWGTANTSMALSGYVGTGTIYVGCNYNATQFQGMRLMDLGYNKFPLTDANLGYMVEYMKQRYGVTLT